MRKRLIRTSRVIVDDDAGAGVLLWAGVTHSLTRNSATHSTMVAA